MAIWTTSMRFGTKIFVAVVVMFVIPLPPAPAGTTFDTIDFDYQRFDPNDRSFTYQGNASTSDGVIEVTTNQAGRIVSFDQYSTGHVVYSKPMHLWDKATGNTADFHTRYSFGINANKNDSLQAYGLAFFLAPNGSNIPSSSDGPYLGLVSASEYPNATTTAYPFVAVEFDTYTSVWDPGYNDPDGSIPHVGIDINSMESVKYVIWSRSNISVVGRFQAYIEYSSGSQNLSVLLTDGTNGSDVTRSTELRYEVRLKDLLPEWVTFGFSATTHGYLFETHTIYSWKFYSRLQVADPITAANNTKNSTSGVLQTSGQSSKTWIWAVIGVGSFLCIGVIIILFPFRRRKEILGDEFSEENDMDAVLINEEFEKVAGPRKFSYEDLVKATDNFSEHRQLGEGGFGKVYEGYLTELKSTVAIKKDTPDSTQGMKEFMAEVKAVSQLRHRSLVQLIGWCHRRRELLLIYEFMSNGSLDTHLFKGKSLLTWIVRYKIAQDLASALLYLHEEWSQCVLHRDIKCSNIMLDSSFNAKLGDFGLARLIDHAKGSQTTVLAGTIGYMAPECLYSGKASKESDVYSFGVVALEIACGRKVFEPRAKDGRTRLVDWVWGLYGTGSLLEAADSELGIDFDAREMECLMIVGLWCAHPDYTLRPSMREVLSVLNFDTLPPVLQMKIPTPTYSVLSSNISASSIISSYSTGSSGSGSKSSTITGS